MREEHMDWEGRTALIQEKAVPVLQELDRWLDENNLTIRPKSPLAQAVAYARARWVRLKRLRPERADGNRQQLVEKVVRSLAVGRKAFLFAGSHKAAEMTAAIYSFMASCKKNGVNEFDWLKDVFGRIQGTNTKTRISCCPITGRLICQSPTVSFPKIRTV